MTKRKLKCIRQNNNVTTLIVDFLSAQKLKRQGNSIFINRKLTLASKGPLVAFKREEI